MRAAGGGKRNQNHTSLANDPCAPAKPARAPHTLPPRRTRTSMDRAHNNVRGVRQCAHTFCAGRNCFPFFRRRPVGAGGHSSSACLITLTARTCIPLWRPNLRVNWNRKLEQMLFWQNSFREPIFQFLTDFEKLPVFLFQCRPASKPPTTSGSPLHVRPHGLRAGQEMVGLAPSKYSCKLEQETGTDAVLAKLLPRTYFSISHRLWKTTCFPVPVPVVCA